MKHGQYSTREQLGRESVEPLCFWLDAKDLERLGALPIIPRSLVARPK